MNVQSENDQPLKSNGNKHNTYGKPKQKPFHLTIDHQTIGHKEKGRQHQLLFTSQAVVDAMLSDLNWEELVGQHEPFNTICFGLSTIQKFQRFENLQPALAWKPLEVIKRTLQATTQ